MNRDLHFVAAVIRENGESVSVRALSHFLGHVAFACKEDYRKFLRENEELAVLEGI